MTDYVGQTLNLRLIQAVGAGSSKRRKVTGKLEQLGDKQLSIVTPEGEQFDIALDNIDKAN